MKITRFEDLPIWKDALKATRLIYDVTSLPRFNNEFIRYLKIAKGSVGETRNHLYIASSVGYISESEFKGLNNQFSDLANQIGGFITYLEKARRAGKFLKK